MTASVSTKTTVNLAIYTADKSLAATYNVVLTVTPIYPIISTSILPGYSYPTTSTAPYAASITVVDPCTRTTITA